VELLPENRLAWSLWRICSDFRKFDRMVGVIEKLEIPAVLDICRAYDATQEDFEKILLIEQIFYPRQAQKLRK
jgi:hypothetical protein